MALGLGILAVGGWLVGRQLTASANPSVNGVCDGVDRCLEPTESSAFIGRAIESDPDQSVGRHEWDFNGGGSFGTAITCSGSACTQPCGDGAHGDCSVTNYSYDDPTLFSGKNELRIDVGLRGVDTEGAAGVPQTRTVGVAIAYVGPDRGSSNLRVTGLAAGGFTVAWDDVTDVPGSAYTLHVDNLDTGTSDLIPVANDKPIGNAYSVPYTAQPTTDYLVWVTTYYPTASGPITRQNFPDDPIVGVPVTTPANAAPAVAVLRQPGNVPPAPAAPHYQLLRQPGNVLTLNVTVSDADGDQLAELRIDGLSALPGASFSGFSTPTPGPVTRAMTWNLNMAPPPAGDYSITVVARDVVGSVTSLPLVIRLNSAPDAPASLQVNVNDASTGLASGDPSPVAQVVDDNLADQNLKVTYRHVDSDGDAAVNYRIQVDTDSAFASPRTWDSGTQTLSVSNGTRSPNVTYVGPSLAYATDYWWRAQVGDTNGNLSPWGSGRFKLRPTNYTPVLGPLTSPYSVDVGSTLTINLTATDQDIVDGIPQILTFFTPGALPSPRMALNPSTGQFTFTPISADLPPASPYSFQLCVRDSYAPPAQACANVTINVNLNLAAPTGLSVAFSSPTAGTASWTHGAPGEDGFQLDQTSPVSTANLLTTGANVTNGSFTFNRCDSTSTVGFQVRAYVDPGAGRQFSSAATANAGRPGFAAPTGLSVAATGNTTARISWTPGTTGQTGYAVYNGATRLANAAADATSYDVTGLTPASSYTFRVRPFVTVAGCLPGNEVLGAAASVNWTQPNPAFTVTPASLAFGNVVKDANSPTQTVTVRNTGGVVLTGITASLTGADAGQFALLNTPPASLATGATWDAQVQFRPTAYGARAAQLQVAASAFGLSSNVALTGTGIPVAPVITSASWDANEPSKYSVAWTWGPGDPDDFSLQMPLGTEQFRVTLGNLRGRNNQPLTQCYMATGTVHTLNLLAFDGGYSAPATANLGLRPGWEAMGSPTFSWLSNTSARLSWSDPAPVRSRYEVRVWNGASAVFSATSTDDATSLDLTGLVAGTNYTVTVRPFRAGVDMPGCSPATLVYGDRASLSYRQPIIDLEVYIQGTPANPLELAELDGGGVWIGDDLSFPLRIRNAGDPLTITGSSYTVSGGSITTPGIFSNVWPAPFNTGADWNTNVQFQAVSAPNVELTVTVQLQAGPYGQVLSFPVKVVPLVDNPGVSREVFATQATHAGDFGNNQGEVEANANAFCQADPRANPAKRYRALLWFDNAPLPGMLAGGALYRNQSGDVAFGTRPASGVAPYPAQHAISSPGQSVWTGRGMSGPAYDCSNWTGGWGAAANTGDLSQWSLAYGGSSNCGTVQKAIYCVEVPTIDGDYVVVTEAGHSGDFKNDSGLGGSSWFAKANDFCQVDSRTEDTHEWRALMWGGASLPQTVTRAGISYYNQFDEFMFTAASDNDVPETLANPVFHGIDLAHTGYQSAAQCAASGPWSWSGASGINGSGGYAHYTDVGWLGLGSQYGCGLSQNIYCVRQPTPAKRIVRGAALASGNGAFGVNASIPGATWWEKANYVCQSSANTDDSSEWRALLWADGALPQTVTHAGTLYISDTGHRLFTAAADNDVPTNIDYQVNSISESPATAYGNPAADCNAWTTTSGTRVHGQTNSATGWLNGAPSYSCSSNTYFYCVEQ